MFSFFNMRKYLTHLRSMHEKTHNKLLSRTGGRAGFLEISNSNAMNAGKYANEIMMFLNSRNLTSLMSVQQPGHEKSRSSDTQLEVVEWLRL